MQENGQGYDKMGGNIQHNTDDWANVAICARLPQF